MDILAFSYTNKLNENIFKTPVHYRYTSSKLVIRYIDSTCKDNKINYDRYDLYCALGELVCISLKLI